MSGDTMTSQAKGLRVNGPVIGDEIAQFYYIYLNLDSSIQSMEAENKLFQLKQGTDSLPVFTAKFERTLYEAGGQSWPDINKISSFRNSLNSTLRSRLAQQLNLPRTYIEFLRTAQQLSQVTVIAINNNDYEDSNSDFDNSSYNRTRSELEIEAKDPISGNTIISQAKGAGLRLIT
ncbi:hypothetical protein NA56DRAFT_673598 [Hyaloscypha hepaticicola]|uniref:Retrotransposon gag domain-containing protein n=1 Tax=Hyaloscypha hepaticicola TaxID=2082293 RepID=A0A2J6PP43_9HELO|nr:hypothetical protein NA56DRAFT_673598 [Hyaloscypha hepaticicola]